jgi:xylulose-5-phosphate/fructose-6-phosphate phosphoketolase
MAAISTPLEKNDAISAFGLARSTVEGAPLSADELRKLHAFWRACNYLARGMIYLQDNPLLRKPLKPEHIKNRLLARWGASPALSFAYTHLNRAIKKYDLDAIFLAGPGHGAPGVLGPVYLEGTYSEIYPDKSLDAEGLKAFFKQFSFPGGIGSHCTPETPGSIHEGGELGYVLSHASGAAFDNPDLIVTAVVGDGEAETGPLATAWHINKFLKPARDGAVLPILNLNGYKINNPTLLTRISHEELQKLFEGYGWTPYFVEASDPNTMHQAMAATLDRCVEEIRAAQARCRRGGTASRPRWPMIVLRSPKGWTAPGEIDGHKVEGYWRAHQVPIADVKKNPAHLKLLEDWLRSYRPEALFDENGAPVPEIRAQAPTGPRRMGANPPRQWRASEEGVTYARFPGLRHRRRPARSNRGGKHPASGCIPARHHESQPAQFPGVRSGRKYLQPAQRRVRGQQEVLDRELPSGGWRRGRAGP